MLRLLLGLIFIKIRVYVPVDRFSLLLEFYYIKKICRFVALPPLGDGRREIQNYLICLGKELGQEFSGQILVNGDSVVFRVRSLTEIVNVILPHFDKYPLITQKLADYLLFCCSIYKIN